MVDRALRCAVWRGCREGQLGDDLDLKPGLTEGIRETRRGLPFEVTAHPNPVNVALRQRGDVSQSLQPLHERLRGFTSAEGARLDMKSRFLRACLVGPRWCRVVRGHGNRQRWLGARGGRCGRRRCCRTGRLRNHRRRRCFGRKRCDARRSRSRDGRRWPRRLRRPGPWCNGLRCLRGWLLSCGLRGPRRRRGGLDKRAGSNRAGDRLSVGDGRQINVPRRRTQNVSGQDGTEQKPNPEGDRVDNQSGASHQDAVSVSEA